jgi:D-alanyl-D-alanine dipeptidase
MSPFGKFEEYRHRPIPNLDGERAALSGARQWPIDKTFQGPDPLVPWGHEGRNLYHGKHNAPYYHEFPGSDSGFLLRKQIKKDLTRINWEFRGTALELFLLDAWRSQKTQTACREWFAQHLRDTEKTWSEEMVQREVAEYWALGPATDDEVNLESPPPHSTGAAIDLTLAFSRNPLWMGTIPDDTSEAAHPDYFEKHPEYQKVVGRFTFLEALWNRRLLYWVMTEAGFVVHPYEWWHVSKGDQIWAKLMSHREGKKILAYYSAIQPEKWRDTTKY